MRRSASPRFRAAQQYTLLWGAGLDDVNGHDLVGIIDGMVVDTERLGCGAVLRGDFALQWNQCHDG